MVETFVWVILIVLVEFLFFGKAGKFGAGVLAGIGFGIFFALVNHFAIAQIKKATDGG